jgi:putative transposase
VGRPQGQTRILETTPLSWSRNLHGRRLTKARLKRYFVPDQPQHVIQRGNNREPTFAAAADYQFYLDVLREASERHGLQIHAYVLMTNHVHLLATPESPSSLPKTLQSLGRRYVQYFNYTYGRTGTLWEGRYRATVIDTERYLLTCMRYVELNPVRAGMVTRPGEYRWSSYHRNGDGASDPLVGDHDLYRRLGRTIEQRCAAYRRLFRSQLPKADLEAIREATHSGCGTRQ